MIISTTVVVLLVGGFLVAFLLVYQNRHNKHLKEMTEVKHVFEQTLLRSQLEMQEQTFNIISQEIHDNVGQVLSLAKVQLNIIDQQESTDKTLLMEVKENISKAMTDLRDIAKSLSTDRIQLADFVEAVEQELNRINRTGIVHASVHAQGVPRRLPEQKKLILFRIIQESLQNIIKHAQASRVQVLFRYDEEYLRIDIEDNGRGFDTGKINNNGLGIQNIIKRTSLIGGTADVISRPEEGTTITLTIPYA